LKWKHRSREARSRFFSWSRDRTENRIPLFLIALYGRWRAAPNPIRSVASALSSS
jgi:hypothetical protein